VIEKSTIGFEHKFGKYINNEIINQELKLKPTDITFCFPAWNVRPKIVYNTLLSLCNQNIGKPKIILSDISSNKRYSNRYIEICKELEVEYIYHKEDYPNKPLALIYATERINTLYIHYGDVDEIHSPNFVEVTLKTLQKYPNAIIFCKRKCLPYVPNRLNFERFEKDFYLNKADLRHGYGNSITVSTELMKLVCGMNIELMSVGHGQDLYMRLLAKGCKELWIDNFTSLYHQKHSRHLENLKTAEERIKFRKTVFWFNNKKITEIKKFASNFMTNGHAKFIHDNKMFLPSFKQKERKNISFIVGIRNKDLKLVKEFLKSINEQEYKNFELIVIDYGSDETYSSLLYELCKNQLQIDWFLYRVEADKWGRSKALNTGLFLANYEYVCFIDADIVLEKEFTSRLERFLDKNKIISFDVRYIKYEDLSGNLFDNSYFYPFGLGISAGYKKNYIEIGGFDERLEGWGIEDNDLIERFIAKGIKVIPAYPHCILYHIEHPVLANEIDKRKNLSIVKEKFEIDKRKYLGKRLVRQLYPQIREFKLDLKGIAYEISS